MLFLFSELRKTLQKQEEETKEREKNIDELQSKNESLKSDLTKADKERKELAHKVGAAMFCFRGREERKGNDYFSSQKYFHYTPRH